MTVQIFEATTKQAEAITRLLLQLGYPYEIKAVAKRIEENQRPGYRIFVAEVNLQIVGVIALHTYTQLHIDGLVGRIMTFCVDDASQGQGIGSMLLKYAEAYFTNQKCVKIELNSNSRRTKSHQFYLKNGYQQTSLHFVKKLV